MKVTMRTEEMMVVITINFTWTEAQPPMTTATMLINKITSLNQLEVEKEVEVGVEEEEEVVWPLEIIIITILPQLRFLLLQTLLFLPVISNNIINTNNSMNMQKTITNMVHTLAMKVVGMIWVGIVKKSMTVAVMVLVVTIILMVEEEPMAWATVAVVVVDVVVEAA